MKLLKKLFSFSIGSISAAIIGVISIPILTRIIEPAEYGIATIFLTIGSLLGIISIFGLDQAFVRFFYEKDKIDLLKKAILSSLIILICITLILFLFDEGISGYVSEKGNYALVFSIYIFSYIVFRFSNLILRMMQFGYRYSIILTLQKALEFVFIINFALFVSPSHYAILFGSIATMLILSVLSLFMSKSFWLQSSVKQEEVKYSTLIKYSYPLMLSTLMALLFQSFDKFFLNYWGSSEDLGVYSAGFKLIAILNILQMSFAVFWAPVTLEQFKKDSANRLIFSTVSKTMTLIMITIAVLIIMLKDVLVLFLGSNYHDAASVIPALVLMPIMYTMSETTVQGINFFFKTHLHILITAIALTINILLSILLIPNLGMEGAALSVGLAYTSFYFTRTYYGLKYFTFDIKFYETLMIIICLILWIILVTFFTNNYILYLGGILILFLLFKLFKSEVIEIYNFIKVNIKSTSK